MYIFEYEVMKYLVLGKHTSFYSTMTYVYISLVMLQIENTRKAQFIPVDDNWLTGNFICVLIFSLLINFTLSAFGITLRIVPEGTLHTRRYQTEVRCILCWNIYQKLDLILCKVRILILG